MKILGRVEIDLTGISPRDLSRLYEEVVETVERLHQDEGMDIIYWKAYKIQMEEVE